MKLMVVGPKPSCYRVATPSALLARMKPAKFTWCTMALGRFFNWGIENGPKLTVDSLSAKCYT